MHGVALRVPRTVRPRGLKTPPSAKQTPGVTGEEGRFGPAVRAGKHVRGRNRTATADAGRESVPHRHQNAKRSDWPARRCASCERRGNAQPEYPLRGIPPV